jgi:hypothetical protein
MTIAVIVMRVTVALEPGFEKTETDEPSIWVEESR